MLDPGIYKHIRASARITSGAAIATCFAGLVFGENLWLWISAGLALAVAAAGTWSPQLRFDLPSLDGKKDLVILIHGTFAFAARWTQSSKLCDMIRSSFDEEPVLARYLWTGGNHPAARSAAAEGLRKMLLQAHEQAPGIRIHLIAHSHGGGIALDALDSDLPIHVHGVACLSTPFLHVRPRVVARSPWPFDLPVTCIATMFAVVGVYAVTMWVPRVSELTSWTYARDLDLIMFVLAFFLSLWFGQAIGQALELSALKFYKTQPSTIPSRATRVLILRTDGDEASGVLAAAHFLSVLVGKIFLLLSFIDRRVKGASDTFERWGELLSGYKSNDRLERLDRYCRLGSVILFASSVFVLALAHRTMPVVAYYSFWIASVLLIVSWLPYALAGILNEIGPMIGCLMLIMVGLAAAPILLLLVLCLLPFGAGYATTAMFLEVSPEPTPPGRWVVHQLAAFKHSDNDPNAVVSPTTLLDLVHCTIYNHPQALREISGWLKSATRTEERRTAAG